MEKILQISLKLNFTPSTLGYYGIRKYYFKAVFLYKIFTARFFIIFFENWIFLLSLFFLCILLRSNYPWLKLGPLFTRYAPPAL